MKLTWLTDIHLNFLDKEKRLAFYQQIIDAEGDKILITGDIAEAASVTDILTEMRDTIQRPIYFVLGNHDYYRGSVASVREAVTNMTQKNSQLYWLPTAGPQNLGDDVFLLGQDTWADGRYGDYANSYVVLNDSRMIQDLFQSSLLSKYSLVEKMQELADYDAKALKTDLQETLKTHHPRKIIVLIHVPPFKEACMHEGEPTNDDFLPFFSSKATGDVLAQIAKENSNTEFLVLCGHTHSEAFYQPYRNLTVKVGHAEYRKLIIQEVITCYVRK